MTEEAFKRKLTAILSADVAGYSRLMGEDEEGTVRTLTTYRNLMKTTIEQHRGRVVDSPGDNLLAEFASVVDAVQCATEVQQLLRAKNEDLPEDRKMRFRIGINLGDVIEEGDRIYGDGVNIAARVEGLAEPGGICISGTVYEHIKDKLALWNEFVGEHAVKNIKHPVRVYRIGLERGDGVSVVDTASKRNRGPWRITALVAIAVIILAAAAVAVWRFYPESPTPPLGEDVSQEPQEFELPDKPSIAVLPFSNMSDDAKQTYFSDGITEEIISSLSKVPGLFVIARNSTFVYKGKAVNVKEVARALGVRYVLEGSVRKAGNRVRITAQLIDAETGDHIWSERYDRDLKDIFALQDEIAMKITTALQVKLTEGEAARLTAKGSTNLEAYLKFLEAREHFISVNRESNAFARQKLEEVIALDPNYPAAYRYLAATHFLDIYLKSTESPKQSMREAIRLATKAISLDPSYGDGHAFLGVLLANARQYEKGVAQAEKGVALAPNSAFTWAYLGWALRLSGRWEEAMQAYEKALRMNPFPPSNWVYSLGMCYLYTGQCDQAIEHCEKAVHMEPMSLLNQVVLTAAYAICGREEAAQSQAKKVLEIQPKFRVEYFGKRLPFKNKSDREFFLDGLKKARLREVK